MSAPTLRAARRDLPDGVEHRLRHRAALRQVAPGRSGAARHRRRPAHDRVGRDAAAGAARAPRRGAGPGARLGGDGRRRRTGLAFALYYRIMQTIGTGSDVGGRVPDPAVAVVYGATLLDEPIGGRDRDRPRADPGRVVPDGPSFARARLTSRPWIFTNIRARSSSPATASRPARAVSPPPRRRPSRRRGARRRPVVVKAQVLAGGRGKAGGVKVADDPADAEEKTRAASSASTSRATSRGACGSRRPSRSTRILLLDHVRPRARRRTCSCSPRWAAWTSRPSRSTTPTSSPGST